ARTRSSRRTSDADEHQLGGLADHGLARFLDAYTESNAQLRAEPHSRVVPVSGSDLCHRRTFQLHDYLRRCDRQALSCTDKEGDAVPSPRIDLEPDCRERLDLRIGGDSALAPIALELSSNEVAGREWLHLAKDFDHLIADRFMVGGRGRLHGEKAHHLHHVVLYDIADRTDFLVEIAAAFHTERLSHRDLHAFDVVAVPDRLEERIGEAEHNEVLDRLLAEIVVDAKDRRLVEHGVEGPIEGLGGGEVPAERLLDDHARSASAARLSQMLGDDGKHARLDGEIVDGVCRSLELAAERVEGGPVVVVALDIAHERR